MSDINNPATKPIGVLFVCLGNICRSPTAHGVFEQKVKTLGLSDQVFVDSAGTAAYHVGQPPDKRAIAAAKNRGYQLDQLRARQAVSDDFYKFDYILVMDRHNYESLSGISPRNARAQLFLFLDYTEFYSHEVPDPYYGGPQGFDHVLDLVEAASDCLLLEIQRRLTDRL